MDKFVVLQISGAAGLGSLLNKYRKAGNSFYVKKNSLSSRLNEYYGGKSFPNMKKLIINAIFHRKKYQIIHIHGSELLVPIFKLFNKKVVLHYHGSDINIIGRNNNPFRIICRSLAGIILIADPHMKPKTIGEKQIISLPNLIDTNSFTNIHTLKNDKALCIVSRNLDITKIKKFNSVINKNITYYDLTEQGIIDIRDMPKFLAQYEYYIDNKITDFGKYLDAFSTVGLQALSLGLTVIHNGQEFNQFPIEHNPAAILTKLEKIYGIL